MDYQAIKAADLQGAYRCTFSPDQRVVTVVLGVQLIAPFKLQFGEDLPKDTSVMPEQFQVLLEVPIQNGSAMMAMAKIEIFSDLRQQHARFGLKTDQEDFLTQLTSQMQRMVKMKAGRKTAARPVTRTPLEGLVDEMADRTLKGEVGEKGEGFVRAWLDKNLENSGSCGETLFLASALTLYQRDHARRQLILTEEEGPEEDDQAAGDP